MPQRPVTPPTGAQYELRRHEHRAVVVEVGGALRSYTVDGRPLLDGYEEHEMVTGARGQTLAPWPNRLADGSYEWDGERQQVALTEPEKHNAIHGLARWVNWANVDNEADSVTMRYVLHPQPGWPFTLLLENRYELNDDGLTVHTHATNVGERPSPYGTGAHPYLTVGTPTIDEAEVHLDASAYFPTDERGLPKGRDAVEGTPYDLRSPARLGDRQIDVAFTELARDPQGRARLTLRGPDRAVSLWVDEAYPFLEVFTGDTLPQGKRRTGLGVEPMTCAPNALRTGDGIVRLDPGERHTARWGIQPS